MGAPRPEGRSCCLRSEAIQQVIRVALGIALLVAAAGLIVRAYIRLVERARQRDGARGALATGAPERRALDNGNWEFLVAAGNLNATGNKANGVTISRADGSAFPTSCIGTP
jgi:hypothetical protein